MFSYNLNRVFMNRLELVRSEIDTVLLNQEDVNVRPEGYIHLYGVAQNCAMLAIKRGLDVEICTIIGLLHDIYIYKEGNEKEHAMFGSIVAENILRDLEMFSEDEIEIVKTAIIHHSDRVTKHDKYSELLKDADVLQNSLYLKKFDLKNKKRIKKVFKESGMKTRFKELAREFVKTESRNFKIEGIEKPFNK